MISSARSKASLSISPRGCKVDSLDYSLAIRDGANEPRIIGENSLGDEINALALPSGVLVIPGANLLCVWVIRKADVYFSQDYVGTNRGPEELRQRRRTLQEAR